MTKYFYRGWVGDIPVSGNIDLPDGVPWAKEAATEWIVEKLRRETPFPVSCLQRAHIAYFEEGPVAGRIPSEVDSFN